MHKEVGPCRFAAASANLPDAPRLMRIARLALGAHPPTRSRPSSCCCASSWSPALREKIVVDPATTSSRRSTKVPIGFTTLALQRRGGAAAPTGRWPIPGPPARRRVGARPLFLHAIEEARRRGAAQAVGRVARRQPRGRGLVLRHGGAARPRASLGAIGSRQDSDLLGDPAAPDGGRLPTLNAIRCRTRQALTMSSARFYPTRRPRRRCLPRRRARHRAGPRGSGRDGDRHRALLGGGAQPHRGPDRGPSRTPAARRGRGRPGGRGHPYVCDHIGRARGRRARRLDACGASGASTSRSHRSGGGNEGFDGETFPDGRPLGTPFWSPAGRADAALRGGGRPALLLAAGCGARHGSSARRWADSASSRSTLSAGYLGDVFYDGAKMRLNRLAFDNCARSRAPHGGDRVALSPGHVRRERVARPARERKRRRRRSSSGRALAALATDRMCAAYHGPVLVVATADLRAPLRLHGRWTEDRAGAASAPGEKTVRRPGTGSAATYLGASPSLTPPVPVRRPPSLRRGDVGAMGRSDYERLDVARIPNCYPPGEADPRIRGPARAAVPSPSVHRMETVCGHIRRRVVDSCAVRNDGQTDYSGVSSQI